MRILSEQEQHIVNGGDAEIPLLLAGATACMVGYGLYQEPIVATITGTVFASITGYIWSYVNQYPIPLQMAIGSSAGYCGYYLSNTLMPVVVAICTGAFVYDWLSI